MKTNAIIGMLAGVALGCSRARWARKMAALTAGDYDTCSRARWARNALALWMFIALFTAAASAQQLSVPLHFGMVEGAVDEWDQLLEGTAQSPGALVQILGAANGVFPPDYEGNPHPDNPVLAEIRIGQGTDPAAGALGKASGSASINRHQSTKIFARIFNRPTKADSSFYADSPVYTNSTRTYGIFQITAAKTDQPIDTRDDDGDGLINSWERSLGTDPYLADTDGDGVSDYHEMLAGTDPTDAADVLQMAQVIPQANGTVVVKWDSVPGKTYQIQHTTLDLAAPEAEFVAVGKAIEAVRDETVTVITNLPGVGLQHFRVVLVE